MATMAGASIQSILHPGLIMLLMGGLVLLVNDKYRKYCYIAAPILALLTLFVIGEGSSLTYNITNDLTLSLINCDKLSFIFLVAFCIISVIGCIYSCNTDDKYEMAAGLFYAGCNMGVVLAGDVLTVLVFWELSALASTYVVYCGRSNRSTRAAFRYLLVHAFGGSVLLVGMLLYMYHFGGSIQNISDLKDMPTFWIIFVGAGINAAIPPINSWMPDAYPESSIGGTVFLGSFTTKSAIYLLIRFFAGSEWLVWVGAFMAIYGIIMAMLENDLRRLFSYHIMSQLGYIIAALSMGGAWGIDGAAAHTFNNIMYKGTLLMCAGAVIYATGKRKISELGGLGKKMPFTAVCFLIASFAISGVPFLNGFASKALIMHAVEHGGYAVCFWLLTAASVGTWLSIALKVNYFVFWGPTKRDVRIEKELPVGMKIGMALGAGVCVATGLFPQLIYNITPFATDANPFTWEHVFEYVILFIGGTLVFKYFINRMEPHDEISVDFDWFYRKPLNNFVLWISKKLYAFFDWFAVVVLKGVRTTHAQFNDPYIWMKKSRFEVVRNHSLSNEDHHIGDAIAVNVFVLTMMVLLGIIFC